MSKVCRVLLLSTVLFLVTNEAWMVQPHGDRKIALSFRESNLTIQDSSDRKQLDGAEELADRLLRMDLSSERISIEDFIACVGKMGPLISNGEILNEVGSLITELQTSKHKPEKEVIKIAKRLVGKLGKVIFYEDIIVFIIRQGDLSFAQALFKLDFPFVSDKVHPIFRMAEKVAYMFEYDTQSNKVYKYLKANNDLLYKAEHGSSEMCLAALQAGACVNVKWGGMGFVTPLHGAVSYLNEGVTDVLIAAGADVNAQDWHKRTPLHAVINGSVRIRGDVDKCKRIVGKLLAAGARLDMEDDDGLTPLALAQEDGLGDLFAEFGIQ